MTRDRPRRGDICLCGLGEPLAVTSEVLSGIGWFQCSACRVGSSWGEKLGVTLVAEGDEGAIAGMPAHFRQLALFEIRDGKALLLPTDASAGAGEDLGEWHLLLDVG